MPAAEPPVPGLEQVRPATRDDAARCGELVSEAVRALHQFRGGPLLARREAGLVAKALLRPGGLDRLLGDARRRVVVGGLEGVVTGLAVGRLDQVGEAAVGVVDVLYVEPDARQVGTGRALLDDLLGWFALHRCRGIDVAALPGDRATKNFLEGAGFKARLLTMHRDSGG